MEEAELLKFCDVAIVSAEAELSQAVADRDAKLTQLASATPRPPSLLDRIKFWSAPVDPRVELRNQVEKAEGSIEYCEDQLGIVQQLRPRLVKRRIRHKAKTAAAEQMREAAAQRRSAAYRQAIEALVIDRGLLLIQKHDYKRGNSVDNYIRKAWRSRIDMTYRNRCFICESPSALTLDHLWLPKNDGGNFVVRVRHAKVLVGNVLVLCHSCNSAKADRHVGSMFSKIRIDELHAIQVELSTQFNADRQLSRIAFGFVQLPLDLA